MFTFKNRSTGDCSGEVVGGWVSMELSIALKLRTKVWDKLKKVVCWILLPGDLFFLI